METHDIDLQPIELKVTTLEIEGDSPLVVHRFSDKARKEIEARQGGQQTKSSKKTIRKPDEEFEEARYRFPDPDSGDSLDGFPAVAVKKAMIDAGFRYMGLAKVDLRGDMHINPDLLTIDSPPPVRRDDTVRLAGPGRTADMRYRPEYWPWSMTVKITYKPDRISVDQLIGMLAHAGFSGGLGEMRPSQNGDSFGRFSVKGAWGEEGEKIG